MRRKRQTCVIRIRRRRQPPRRAKAEPTLKDLREQMKLSRKALSDVFQRVLDYTPILNFKDEWHRRRFCETVSVEIYKQTKLLKSVDYKFVNSIFWHFCCC
jgi:AraC-like DNA-binding protein